MRYHPLIWAWIRWILLHPRTPNFLQVLALVLISLPYKGKVALFDCYYRWKFPQFYPADPLGIVALRSNVPLSRVEAIVRWKWLRVFLSRAGAEQRTISSETVLSIFDAIRKLAAWGKRQITH